MVQLRGSSFNLTTGTNPLEQLKGSTFAFTTDVDPRVSVRGSTFEFTTEKDPRNQLRGSTFEFSTELESYLRVETDIKVQTDYNPDSQVGLVKDVLMDNLANGTADNISNGVVLDAGTVVFDQALDVLDVTNNRITAQFNIFEGDINGTFDELQLETSGGNDIWVTKLDTTKDDSRRFIILVEIISS